MDSSHDQTHLGPSSSRKSTHKSVRRRITEAGNIFLTLFGAIGMVGVIGASTMTVMQGPVKTMSEVTKRTVAENNMIAAGKLALMASINQTGGGDCDTDSTIEPIEMSATPIAGFVGGSEIPPTIGTSKEDSWGMKFGYCAWDHGTGIDAGGCAGQNRLAGGDVVDQYVLAVVSAGPDGVFETTCNDYIDADTNNEPDVALVAKLSGADDLIMGYTYEEATALSGGLWNVEGADPNTAEIGKNISVKDSGGTEQFAFDAGAQTLTVGQGAAGTGNIPSMNTDFISSMNNATIDVLSPLTTGNIDAGTGTLNAGATTVDSLDAGSGAIQTTGTLNAGASTLGATTVDSLDAGSGAIQTTGTLNAGASTLGATGVTSLSASGLIQTTGNATFGDAVTDTVGIAGILTVGDRLDVSGDTDLVTLGTSGLATLSSLDVTNTTNLNGAVNLGDAAADILTVNGTLTFMSDLDMGNGTNKIIDLATPTAPADATTKAYVDAAVAAGTGYTETDPEVGALTPNKFCTANAGGTAIDCTADVSDSDTLSSLSCSDGEVAKWNNGASAWECAADNSSGGGGGGGTGFTVCTQNDNTSAGCDPSTSIPVACTRAGSVISSPTNFSGGYIQWSGSRWEQQNIAGTIFTCNEIMTYTPSLDGGSGSGGGGGGSAIIDQIAAEGTVIDPITVNSGLDKWPDYVVCDRGDFKRVLKLEFYNPTGSVKYSSENQSYQFNRDGSYNTRDVVDANCGASANDIVTICDESRCGFFGGSGGGGSGGGGDNLGDHTATQDIDAASNDVININMLEFDAVAGDSPVSNSDTLTGLVCNDGQVAAWDNAGSIWVCADQSGGSDNLGDHTATTDVNVASNNVININELRFDSVAAGAPVYSSDTLGGLSCNDGEIAKWNNAGSVWQCAADDAGAGGDNLGAGGTTTGSIYTSNGNIGLDSTDKILFRDSTSDLWMVNGTHEYRFGSNDLTPFATNDNDLGNSTYRWKDGWFAGNVTAGAYFHSSDERLKDNIQTISGLELISQLRGVSYDWKSSGKASAGVIAQEVEEVMPSAVQTDADGMKSVEYDQLIAPLIEAVKELKAQNEALEARIKELEQAREQDNILQ